MSSGILSDEQYKSYIEERVSGHSGTTFTEVIVVTLAAAFVNAASTTFAAVLPSSNAVGARRILEWLMLVPPVIALFSASSISSSIHVALTLIAITTIYLALKFTPWITRRNAKLLVGENNNNNNNSNTNSFYDPATSMLRSSLMLQTVVAILQVDFPIFPFRFMKCESFGISLMDVGVGAFVFSGAISRVAGDVMKAQQQHAAAIEQGSPTAAAAATPLKSFLKLLGPSIPLFVAGVARFTFVAVTGYQSHVTEYGTHWNFFLTLGSMPLVVAFTHKIGDLVLQYIINPIIKNKNNSTRNDNKTTSATNSYLFDAVLGAVLIVLHQFALSRLSLTEYVMSPHRRSFVEGNKEGIVSSVGYSALYLMARGLFGLTLTYASSSSSAPKQQQQQQRTEEFSGSNSNSKFSTVWLLFFVGSIITACAYFLEENVQQFSRRLCNGPYVLFCLGLGFLTYAVCRMVAEIVRGGRSSSTTTKMLTSLGDNQLSMFLLANLGTGSVNKSMRTVFASDLISYTIMIVYVTVVLGVATFCSYKKMKLKFW